MVNLLTVNQADGGEDGTTVGFGLYTTYDTPDTSNNATIASSMAAAWQGTHSIQIAGNDNITFVNFGTLPCPIVAPYVYTFSLYWLNTDIVSASVSSLYLVDNNGVVHNTFNIPGNMTPNVWTRAIVSTNPLLTPTAIQPILVCGVQTGGGKIYVDGLQLEVGSTATPWSLPPQAPAMPFGVFINDTIIKTKVNV